MNHGDTHHARHTTSHATRNTHEVKEAAMDTQGFKAEGVQWNLAELYTSPDDPRIEADLAEARRQAEAFAQKYRGKLADKRLDGEALAQALKEYEGLAEVEHRPSFYANLFFAADTQNS